MPRSRQRQQEPQQAISLVTTRPRAERDVVLRLRSEGVRAYSPRLLEFTHRGSVEQPLFPGYVFVWVCDEWSRIRGTTGVLAFVRSGGSPVVVRPEIVDSIRASENGYGFVVLRPKFSAGQRVRVSGSEGCIGIVRGYEPRMRVRVLLSLLGRNIEMSLPESDLLAA